MMNDFYIILFLLNKCLIIVHSDGFFQRVDSGKIGSKLLQKLSVSSDIKCGVLCEMSEICQSYKAQKVQFFQRFFSIGTAQATPFQ